MVNDDTITVKKYRHNIKIGCKKKENRSWSAA